MVTLDATYCCLPLGVCVCWFCEAETVIFMLYRSFGECQNNIYVLVVSVIYVLITLLVV